MAFLKYKQTRGVLSQTHRREHCQGIATALASCHPVVATVSPMLELPGMVRVLCLQQDEIVENYMASYYSGLPHLPQALTDRAFCSGWRFCLARYERAQNEHFR